jgi:hypothetical protein
MEDQFVEWLFHGTSQENIDTIVKSPVDYNPMLAGSAVPGAIWCDGTYIASPTITYLRTSFAGMGGNGGFGEVLG